MLGPCSRVSIDHYTPSCLEKCLTGIFNIEKLKESTHGLMALQYTHNETQTVPKDIPKQQ